MSTIRVLALLLAARVCSAHAAKYHVAITGDDGHSGDAAYPFQTIQRAATVMSDGDACVIHAGTYREQVTPAGHNVSFAAAPGETVVVSAYELVTNWVVHSGSIYRADLGWNDLGDRNQLLFDGQVMNLARWPDKTNFDPFALEAPWATGTDTSISHPGIPDWNWDDGGVVFFLGKNRWTSWRRPITGASAGVVYFNARSDDWQYGGSHHPADGGEFFLMNILEALDSDGEWYIDRSADRVYFQAPGGVHPTNGVAQVRRRTKVFNLSGKTGVTLNGLHIEGGSVDLKGANGCVVKNCRIYHGNHTIASTSAAFVNDASIEMNDSTTNCRIWRNDIQWGAANGVVMKGTDNRVDNNHIGNFNYLGSYASAVSFRGHNDHLTRNQIFNAGRDVIQGGGDGSDCGYNDIHHSNLINDDCGAIYTCCGKSYNYTLWSNPGEHSQTMARWTNDFSIFNVPVYNTLANQERIESTDEQNTVLYPMGTDPFEDLAGLDFEPRAGTLPVDAGRVIAGVTDGYLGAAPDVGAYERGDEVYWVPGPDWTVGQAVSDDMYRPLVGLYMALGPGTLDIEELSAFADYRIEMSTDHMASWAPIHDFTAPYPGEYIFVDRPRTNDVLFYRVVELLPTDPLSERGVMTFDDFVGDSHDTHVTKSSVISAGLPAGLTATVGGDANGFGVIANTMNPPAYVAAPGLYVYGDGANGSSLQFSKDVEVPSLWASAAPWALDNDPGHEQHITGKLNGSVVWSYVSAEEHQAFWEITTGAGRVIDELVVYPMWTGVDNITVEIPDPVPPESLRLRIARLDASSGEVEVSWPGTVGLRHQLQSAPVVSPDAWVAEGPLSVGVGLTKSVTMATGSDAMRIYRLDNEVIPADEVNADTGVALHGLPPPPPGRTWAPLPAYTDEFNGSGLDLSKWRNGHPYWDGRDPSEFRSENVSVADGKLRIRNTLLRDPSTVGDPNSDIWVGAGCVSSRNRSLTYGYYEAKMKAAALCMTSSFWMQGTYAEIDVVEQIGWPINYPYKRFRMQMNTHYYPTGWPDDIATPEHWTMPTSSSEEYHVYGVWWKDPDTLWMYHNGVKVAEITTGGPFNHPMYMFFDTEVFTWEGLPTPESLQDDDRNTMYVDWVRGWHLVPE